MSLRKRSKLETDMQKNHSNGSIFLLIVLKKDKHFKKLSLNRGRVPSASRTQRKIVFNTFISPDVQTLGPELWQQRHAVGASISSVFLPFISWGSHYLSDLALPSFTLSKPGLLILWGHKSKQSFLYSLPKEVYPPFHWTASFLKNRGKKITRCLAS